MSRCPRPSQQRPSSQPSRRPRYATVSGLALAALASSGCVERTIRVTSEPSGALVRIGDNDVGRTPLETSFLYHGTYDVLVTLDGYEPLRTTASAKPPLYEYPGPDIVAEVLPLTFENTQEWHFVLEPRLEDAVSRADLEAGMLERAHALREQLAQTPPPPPPQRPWLDDALAEPEPAPEADPETDPEADQEAGSEPTAMPDPSTEAAPVQSPAPAAGTPMGQMTPIGSGG